jgi:hypothetical protein
MKKMLCFFAFLIFIPNVYSQDYKCNTVNDAINYFVNSIKNGNIEQAFNVSPYNYDNICKNINPREYIRYMNSIMPNGLNFSSEYFILNKYYLLSGFSRNIQLFLWSLLLNEKFYPLSQLELMGVGNDYVIINEYLSLLEGKNKLQSLEIVRIDLYRPDLQNGERNKQNKEVQQKIFGFNEQWQYTVLYKFNNRYYVGGFIAERYQNYWYISSLNCYLANTSSGLRRVSGLVEYLYNYEYELE